MVEEYKEWLESALRMWLEERDRLFQVYELDIEEVYSSKIFSELPMSCYTAVCYVKAYQTALSKLTGIGRIHS